MTLTAASKRSTVILVSVRRAMSYLKANNFSCEIELLGPDFKTAMHTLKYNLTLTEGDPISTFEWSIPNATPDQVDNVTVIEEGPRIEQKSSPDYTISRAGQGAAQSILLITYGRALSVGEKKNLTFKYRAPTSALVRSRMTYVQGTYIARFEHRFVIENFELKIRLPKRINFIDAAPTARHESTSLQFPPVQLPENRLFVYHVFFGQTPWIPAVSAAVAALLAGGLLHAYVVPRMPEGVRREIFNALSTTAIGAAAIGGMMHNIWAAFFSSIFDIFRRRRKGRDESI